MIHSHSRSRAAALLIALATASLGVGCYGADGDGSSGGNAGGSTASGGDTSSGGSGDASGSGGSGNASGSGGSSASTGGDAGTGGGPMSCDADGDDQRSLACGGKDCDDLSEDVSPLIETDLNLSDSPPAEEGERRVFQVARGADDEIFVLYRLGEGELRLATWSDGEWATEAVGAVAVEPFDGATMVVDGEGKIHVALLSIVEGSDPVTRDLYYTTNAGGAWDDVQVTDSAATDPGASRPRIALDGNGAVHIAFSGDGLRHATNASGSWVVSPIAAGGSGALATDPNGTVHVVHASGLDLFYGPYQSDGFQLTGPVEDAGSGDLVAAFDADGRLHAVAIGFDADSDRVLKYTIIDGASVTAVEPGVGNPEKPRIVLGAEGEVHVFSDIELSTGHLVGMVHVYEGDAGFEVRTLHSTPSYVQEAFGFPSIDGSGRLHRITPTFGEHRYSDDIDNDCDGVLW